ncbi:MAG: non-homologous end-joining DNA ligase [Candidatus Acidiferrales bacterium]
MASGEALAVASFVEPMQCLAVTKLPEGKEWQYELKLDGFRTLAVRHVGRLTLYSRNKKIFNQRFPGIVEALSELPDESIVDGEIVALDDSGRPSFSQLQNFSRVKMIVFFAFDVLMWKSKDIREWPLHERRALLEKETMLRLPSFHYSESFAVPVDRIISVVREQGLEGVVAKRRDSKYEAGRRSGAWVKMRIGGGQEFVIGGYTQAPKNFDAILVGYYEGKKLLYTAKVRNGFVPAAREAIFQHFEKLRIKKCPFANLPEPRKGHWGEGLTAADMKKCVWLKPKLVASIDYAEWTHHLRHANFIGLREDKNPREVTRERPI